MLCEGEQEGNDDLKLLGVEFSTAQLGKYLTCLLLFDKRG